MNEPSGKKAEFDEFAGNYDELLSEPTRDWFADGVSYFHQRKLDVLLGLLAGIGRDPKTMSWLDFGCGRGTLLGLSKSHFGSIQGCDISSAMVQSCDGIDVRQQTSPGEAPFPDQSMDLVTAVCVFHHVPPPDRPALTAEIARVLKPGGIFAIVEHNPFNPMTQLVVKRSPVDANAILLSPSESASYQRKAGLKTFPPAYFLYVPQRLFRVLGGIEKYLLRVPLGGQYFQIGCKPAI